VQDLLDYWAAGNPPLHRMVAAYFEIEEKDPQEQAEEEHRVMSKEELEGWIRGIQG